MTANNIIEHDDASLVLDVWLGSHLTTRPVERDLRHLGLTGDEFVVYSLLHSTGPATPTQISRWTGMAKASVAEMLRQISARGHLNHLPNPDDARSQLVQLTDDGLSVTLRAAKALADKFPRLDKAMEGQYISIGPEPLS